MRGFLLGLASGGACLAYCSPVIVPYLLGEGQNVKVNYIVLCRFLLGRLMGYLIFAVLAYGLGILLIEHRAGREIIFGLSYLLLAVLLIYYCFRKTKKICAAEKIEKFFTGLAHAPLAKHDIFLPLFLGFLTGTNLCPPFLLAFTSAASGGTLGSTLLFFGAFFLGTSLFFLPIPFVGFWKRNQVLSTVGKMAAGIIGAYYFLTGILILIGGVKQ